MESNHHSTRRQGYSLLSSPMLSVRTSEGWPAGFEPAPAGLTTPGASVYTTATMSGDDRTRTGGLSPDKRALCSSELRPRGRDGRRDRLPATGDRDVAVWSAPEPAVAHRRSCQRVSAPPPPHQLALEACRSQLHVRARALHQPLFCHFLGPPVGAPILDSAGGIRTHGLELMRLARTAPPLPRKSGRQESNLRSPAPEAGGVATLPHDQKPIVEAPPAGLEPAASGLRARRHRRFDHGGKQAPAAGLEPALSRVTVARLTDSTTPERNRRRQQDSNLRTAHAVCAVATRCLTSSAMPPRSGRRGSRTPKARRPTRFRDGIPRRWQSFREWPRQASNLQPSA